MIVNWRQGRKVERRFRTVAPEPMRVRAPSKRSEGWLRGNWRARRIRDSTREPPSILGRRTIGRGHAIVKQRREGGPKERNEEALRGAEQIERWWSAGLGGWLH